MAVNIDYEEKLRQFEPRTLFPYLDEVQQNFLRQLASQYRFTFQEFRQIAEACRDVTMWREQNIRQWHTQTFPPDHQNKKEFFSAFNLHMRALRNQAKIYSPIPPAPPVKRERDKIVVVHSENNIFGECPVQSPRTVCCNLKTIDAVESCVFGCTYCTIQTFYSEKVSIDENLAEKLSKLTLDPARRYHIGTGQSSDSLAFGNRNGMLDTLCAFAGEHPNVLLEFKTKSDNVRYFMEHETPPNIVCSWSLNPQIIIDNEEYFTAGLEKRLKAARKVADRGVKVSFHFHPIVYYKTWKEDYTAIARQIMQTFSPQEVLFISFGSVTFIKPVLKKIRTLGLPTKIHQMELVPDPHGKLTYPDYIKTEKFSAMYRQFSPWHGKVFFYLCMEKADIWLDSLGYVYPNNEEFEKDFLDHCYAKIIPGGRNV